MAKSKSERNLELTKILEALVDDAIADAAIKTIDDRAREKADMFEVDLKTKYMTSFRQPTAPKIELVTVTDANKDIVGSWS